MNKFIITAAAFLLGAAAYAQKLSTYPISDRYQLEALGMSANHRYVCGLNVATYAGFVWDTQTGTVTENNGDYANCDFRCVTNEGVAYGILGSEDMVTTNAAYFNTEGKVRFLESEMSQAYAATPDGSIVVGCLLDDIMWWPKACIWKDGERIMLPCPTEAECGIANDGANAQFISSDGKVIAGYLQDWASSRPAIVWRLQDDGTYKADVVSQGLWELRYGDGNRYLRFEPLGLSANGKWLCLSAQGEAIGNMPTPEFMVRMNLETREVIESETPDIEYFDEKHDNCYPCGIADDGTCVGAVKDQMGFYRGVIWKSDEKAPCLLAEAFKMVPEFEGYDSFIHIPVAISSDAQYVAGYACPMSPAGDDYDFVSYQLQTGFHTGIASVKTVTLPSSLQYNLQGQRILSGQRTSGIVILNNKKYLR